jgi:hypothetical protein
MKTSSINWNNVNVQQAAKIFQETFGDNVQILPNMEVFKELKKACSGGKERILELFEDDDQYESTTYTFDSWGGLKMYAEIFAEDGETSIGSTCASIIRNG